MKCPNCGAPLKLEEKFCTYCGARNTLAMKHQRDMEHYEREFAETQEEVLTTTRKAGSMTGFLVVLILMIVLNVIAGVISANAWDIQYARRQAKANKRAEEYRAYMEQMISDQDYISISSYYYNSGMMDGDVYDEYSAIIHYSADLDNIYEELCALKSFLYWENNIDRSASYLSSYLISLYEDPRSSYYQDAAVADDKIEVIEDIRAQAEALLITYAGFTKEETGELEDMSRTRIEETLNEHLEKISEARKAEEAMAAEEAAAGTESMTPEEFLETIIGGDGV